MILGLLAAAALSTAQRAAIDKLVASTMASEHIASASVEVSVDGRPGYVKAYGLADVAAGRRATTATRYALGSLTAQFTAACVLLLAQDGKLSIDDPLSRYVSGLPWGERVTLRHLLDQESGIAEFRAGVVDYTAPLSRADVVARLAQTDLLFPPGSRYEYSNSNYYLLGLVVERASGEHYQDFIHDRVLAPLGLSSTTYAGANPAGDTLARGTIVAAGRAQPARRESPDWSFAAGALESTSGDLARWDGRLGAGALLHRSSLDEMFAPGVLDDGSSTDYAMGWVVVKHNGTREIWHNGQITGFHAMNATYPDRRTDIVVLTNTSGTFAADELAVRIFDTLHPYVPSVADRAAAGRAREWLGRIANGDVDRSQLTDDLNRTLADSVVASIGAQLRADGRLRSVTPTSVDEDASGRRFTFAAAFTGGTVQLAMGIDARGKISALLLRL